MRDKRFLVIIAHPRLGRLARFEVSHLGLQAAASLVVAALLATIGLAAGYFKKAQEAEQLLSQSEAMREEYESLVLTSQEREEHLASLSGLAYQVSIAYGIQRDSLGAEDAFGSDLAPAYYASLNQYDRLQGALDRSSVGGSALLANSTPSIWPVKGHITSTYGRRLDPFHGKGTFHRGIDISAPYGSAVLATADGFVSMTGWDAGLGNCVKILHGRNGFSTTYGHLKEYLVRPGQPVQRGELIGLVGSTGRTTGAHVHYEVSSRGLTVNPYRYLKSKPSAYPVVRAD